MLLSEQQEDNQTLNIQISEVQSKNMDTQISPASLKRQYSKSKQQRVLFTTTSG